MSRAKELGKSIGSILTAQFLGLGFSLIFLAYFGRTLPKSEMALYAFVITMASWVQLLSGFGFATLTVRNVPSLMAEGKREDARRMISSTMFYCSLGGALVGLALMMMAPLLAERVHHSKTYVVEFRILAVVAWIQGIDMTFALMQRALQRFHISAACDIISGIGGRALAWVVYLGFGLRGFLWAFAIAHLTAIVVHAYSMRRELTFRIRSWRWMFSRSRSYVGVDVLRNLLNNLDRPVVGFALGDVALADYFVAKRLFDLFTAASQAVVGPPGVKISEVKTQGTAALNDYFRKSLSLVAFLFIPAGFIVIGVGDPLLRLVAGSKYASGAGILMFFGFAIMAQSISQTWREAVFRLTPARYLIVFTVLLSAVTFPMYCVLLPWLGPMGIPLSYTLACIAASVYSTHLAHRKASLRVGSAIYVRAIMCGIVALAAIGAARLMEENLLGYMVMSMAVIAGYGLGFILFAPAALRDLARRVMKAVPVLRAAFA